jgi:hypothetical protein
MKDTRDDDAALVLEHRRSFAQFLERLQGVRWEVGEAPFVVLRGASVERDSATVEVSLPPLERE